MKRIAILDHDLTLVNTLTYFFRAYNQARAKFNYERLSFREFLRGYLEENLANPPGTDRFEFWFYFSGIFKTFKGEPVNPMPGADDLVQFLSENNYYIVVVTGRRVDKTIIADELGNAGLVDYVREIHTLHNISLSRPFEKKTVISRLVNSEKNIDCISIGDYSEDMSSSYINGCKPLGVAPFGKNPKLLYDAGAIFVGKNLKEIREYIEKNLISSPR